MSVRTRARRVRDSLRTGERAPLVQTVVFLLALAAPVVHWSGLVVGGALVGIVAPTLRRALIAGLYVGGLVVGLFAVFMWTQGALRAYTSMGIVFLASVGVGVGLPILAAGAVRGLT